MMIRVLAVFLSFVSAVSAEVPKFTQQITIDDGLSQSTVSSIYQAQDGRVWFATGDGISIFDGEDFEYMYRSEAADTGLQSNYIRKITQSPKGNIWVGTLGGGISVFSQEREFLWGYIAPGATAPLNDIYDFAWGNDGSVWVATAGGTFRLETVQVDEGAGFRAFSEAISLLPSRAVELLPDGRVLIGTQTQGLEIYSPSSGQVIALNAETSGLIGSSIMDVFTDANAGVWVGTEDGGLNYLDPETLSISQPVLLPDRDIESITQGPDGRMWFGSWSHGVFVYNPLTQELENYRARSGQTQRLSSNSVVSLYAGRTGYMWLGTYDGGVNRVGLYPDPFASYFADAAGEIGPQSPIVWSFAEGGEDDLWVGSKDGLSRFYPAQQRFEVIDLGEGSKDVRAIFRRGDTLLLAIRRRGLVEYHWRSGQLHDVTNDAGEALFDSIFIRLILEDRSQKLWLGTHSGVYRLTPELEIDLHLDSESAKMALPHNRVRSLYEDPDGTIWIGTSGGLSRYNPEDDTLTNFSGSSYFSDNDVRAVWRHPEGTLYVATQAGFSILDQDMTLIREVQRKDGMPNETLYSLLPDMLGNLWITTNNGLVRFHPESEALDVFRTRDGLQGAEFNFNAHLRLADGRIVVGGINGFSLFNPQALSQNTSVPILSWSSTSEEVAPASFSYDVRVTHFGKASQNRLRWRLEPVETQWREASGAKHTLVRENLPAGSYTLAFQGISAAGIPSETLGISFEVRSPWHQRWYAFVLYAFLLSGVILLVLRWRTYRLQQQNLELARIVSQKTLELTQANGELEHAYREKSKFYARAAHEIRTPISLIKAPLQSIAESGALTEKNRALLTLADRAIQRLVRLTDEMAEVSEFGQSLAIQAMSVDVPAFVQPIIQLYEQSAQANGIHFSSSIPDNTAATLDTQALELILHNLLSNAVKYTGKGKYVTLDVSVTEGGLRVRVENDARLPETALASLQSPGGNLARRGTEIIRAMVERTRGSITVRQEPVKIEVFLPAHVGGAEHSVPTTPDQPTESKILVVEDDRELRAYLASALADIAQVQTVASCSAAKRAIHTELYHLVLCDVMLPDGSGFDLIQSIKEQSETSHIPVIFLTALTDSASQRRGLEAWADDYITKPFDLEELKAKVRIRLRNIEALRRHVRNQINRADETGPQEVILAPADERLVAGIEQVIAEKLSKSELSIDEVAKHCAISKRGLQRKLDALYGMTFSDLLTQRRMEHASALLRSGVPITDVSQACGYSYVSSFTRRFKQHYGLLPSKYLKTFSRNV